MKRAAVEVPQFLKHPVKVNGLTGRQFLVLLAGTGVSASCWQGLEAAPRYLAIGCVIAVVVLSLLIAFVRVSGRPLEEWLVMIAAWAMQPDRLQGKAFQRAFQRIKAVDENGIIEIERGGGYVAIIQVEGVFAEQLEQGGFFVEAFTEFLSGLTFPISVRVCMRRGQADQDIVPAAHLSPQVRRGQAHYLSFLHEQLRAKPPRSVLCTVVVSASKQDQCLDFARVVLTGLERAQLSCRLLTAANDIAAFYRLGGQQEETIAARLKVREVRFEQEGGHTYGAGLALSHLPGTLAVGWLARFMQQAEEPYDLRLFLQPVDDHQMEAQLERKAAQFGGALLVAERQGRKGNMITQHALKEVEELRERLLLKKSRLFAMTLVACVYGPSRAKLRERIRLLKQLFRSSNVGVTVLYFQHHLALLSGVYGYSLLSGYAHLLPTEAVASFYPFQRIPHIGPGVLLGATRQGDLVSFDPEAQMNGNLAVLGVPGAGKSFFLKVLSSRLVFHQSLSITIIDIEGEYAKWAEAVGAQQTAFSARSLEMNPFALHTQGQGLREKIGFIGGLVALLVGERGVLTQHEKALVAEAALRCYAACGITDETTTQAHGQAVPVMEDFLKMLKEVEPTSDLVYRLEMYAHLFPRNAEAPGMTSSSHHRVYNLHDLPAELRAPAMYLIIGALSPLLLYEEQRKRQVVIIDEAWFLSQFELGASFLNEFARRARKYNVGLWVGTQQVSDLLAERGEQFRGLLDLCETKVVFRQEVEDLEKLLRLSPSEEQFIRGAGRGAALYLTSKERYVIDVLASKREEEFARGANL